MLAVVSVEACAVGVDNGSVGLRKVLSDAALEPDVSRGVGAGGGSAGGGGASVGSAGRGGVNGGGSSSGGSANGDAAVTDGPLAVDTATGCILGQKSCGGLCVIPEARVGCGLTGCTPCPTPDHSFAHCTETECDFDCLSGYAQSGAICVPSEGGGAGGAGGSNVDAGPTLCVASMCGGCIPFIQAPCCKPDNSCGCQYPFAPCK
jgi:hypothetical protein